MGSEGRNNYNANLIFYRRFEEVKKREIILGLIVTIFLVIFLFLLQKYDSSKISMPWYISKTNIDKYWNKDKPGTIALIDSGYNHDLDDKIYKEQIIAEYNCFDFSNNVNDETGHGSNMVMLLIGKHIKNNIIGVAPSSSIVVLKVTNETGSATEDAMVYAIEKAIELKCDIINISMGTKNASSKVENSIKCAIKRDILVLAAVGDDEEEEFLYPANYEDVIAVTAQRKDGRISQYSNYSYSADSVLFPGVDVNIMSKNINGEYEIIKKSSSSIATVLLSGSLSLVIKTNDREKLIDFIYGFNSSIINFSQLEDI